MTQNLSVSNNPSKYTLTSHNQLLGGKKPGAVFDIYRSFGISIFSIVHKSVGISSYPDDHNQLITDNSPTLGEGILCGQLSKNLVCVAYDLSSDKSNGNMWRVIEQSLPSNILADLVIESSPCGAKLYYYSPRVLTGTNLTHNCSSPLQLIGNGQLSACWPNTGYKPIHGCFLTIKPLTRGEELDLLQILEMTATGLGYGWKSPKTIRKTMSLN